MTEFAIPLVTGQAACQSAEVAGRVRLPRAGGTDRGLTVMAVASVTALKCAGMGLQLHSPAAACPGRWPGSMGGPCGRCAWTCSSLAISSSPMCRSWSVYATCPGHRGGGGHPHQRGGKTRRNRRNRSTDAEVAFILNGKRLRTGQGHTFTARRVATLRLRLGIPSPKVTTPVDTDDARWMDVSLAARELGVSPDTVRRWAREGFLEARQVMPQAPWRIHVTDDVRRRVVPDVPAGWLGLADAAKVLGRS
jgi:hypothetical protein